MNKTCIAMLFGVALIVVGCGKPRTPVVLVVPDRPTEQMEVQFSVEAPEAQSFSVAVTLSEKAMKELTDKKETVMVSSSLSGQPKKEALKKYVSEIGDIGLGYLVVEVAPGQRLTTADVKLDRKALEQTDKQSPELLINVYSGRKSSENNLLDCGFYQATLRNAQGATIPINCKLIGE